MKLSCAALLWLCWNLDLLALPASGNGFHLQTPEQAALVQANNAFALDLYSQLRSHQSNLFFSPYSISATLAMTAAGARGQTATQMLQALHLSDTGSGLHQTFGQLNRSLLDTNATRGLELHIANSLWPEQSDFFAPSFLQLVQTNYDASIAPQNFRTSPQSACQAINQWVSARTARHIPRLLAPSQITSNTSLVLVNAIYFKGSWQTAFPAQATRTEPFHLDSTHTCDAPLMHQTGRFDYFENALLQLLCLPYEGDHYEMVLLLPQPGSSLSQLEQQLSPALVASWLAAAAPASVQVTVPRFKLETALPLNAPLTALGIDAAFSPQQADFSGINGKPHDLYISLAIHQALVDVNETNTEAAAATGVVVAHRSALVHSPPRLFRADHPFILLIRDRLSGTWLFLGRLLQPPTGPAS